MATLLNLLLLQLMLLGSWGGCAPTGSGEHASITSSERVPAVMAGMEQDDCAPSPASCQSTGQHSPCAPPSDSGACLNMVSCATMLAIVEWSLGPDSTTGGALEIENRALRVPTPVRAPELPPPRA